MGKVKEFKVEEGTWVREVDGKGETISEFFIPKKGTKKEVTSGTPGWHEPRHDEDDPEEQIPLGKADWCTSAGGKWITDDGQHICVGIDDESKVPEKVRHLVRVTPKFDDSKYFKQTKEGIKADLFRHGKENTDKFRGGTWYENQIYEGQRSTYELGGPGQKPTGVGGKGKHTKKAHLKQPYYIKWESGHTEGQIVVDMGNTVLGKDVTDKLKRGITGYKAEEAYARIERSVSDKLGGKGYDGVVFYTKVGKAPPYPNQTFVFDKDKVHIEKVSESKKKRKPIHETTLKWMK